MGGMDRGFWERDEGLEAQGVRFEGRGMGSEGLG